MNFIKIAILTLFIFYLICLLPINKYFKICYEFDMIEEKDKLKCDPSGLYSKSIFCKNPLREYLTFS